MTETQFDPELYELIPHRPPMLLINHVHDLNKNRSEAIVTCDEESPFYQSEGGGVPSWIGLEYMGQTAALIAGYQLKHGLSKPHLGFLLGARDYKVEVAYFKAGENLLVKCAEAALVGESLATFDCTIESLETKQQLASANLSVFRKPIENNI